MRDCTGFASLRYVIGRKEFVLRFQPVRCQAESEIKMYVNIKPKCSFKSRYSMLGRVEDPANELSNGDVYMTNSKRDSNKIQTTEQRR